MKYIVETKGVIGNYNNDIKYKTEKDMNKEQFVLFEVAKLLKEKGFNWQTEFVWYEHLPPSIDWRNKTNQKAIDYFYFNETTEHHSSYRNCDKKPSYINGDIYSAPTVYEVIDWLETRGYWIVYRPLDYYKGVIVSILAADDADEWYDVNNITAETKYEGLNNALKFCLEHLI